MNRISIKEAKRISIAKWKKELEAVVNWDEIEEEYPEIYEYHNCGFCLRHGYSKYPTDASKCKNCEIANSEAKCCLENSSLYFRINDTFDNDEYEELVKELISIIEEIEEIEEIKN